MTETIVTAVLAALTGTFLPDLSKAIFGRRKLSAEAQAQEIDNAVKTVAMVTKSLEDSDRRLKEANQIIDELKEHSRKLEDQLREQVLVNVELNSQLRALMKTNQDLIQKLEQTKQT